MNLQDFCALMERVAPSSLACEWDNVGLLIAPDHTELHKVLVALDCSVSVANEAIAGGYDLVLTHHPLFFKPIQRILPDGQDTAAACLLLRHGIGLFAAHTNLDACAGGVNDCLAAVLGLKDVAPLPPEGLGRMGLLPAPTPFSDFIALCEDKLNTVARFTGDGARIVQKIGLIGGGAGDEALVAKEAGCDAYLTGEMKHHEALYAAQIDMPCCVLGHYETEAIVLKPLITRLQNQSFDVQYHVTLTEKAALACSARRERI